jgi:hypothetical protein
VGYLGDCSERGMLRRRGLSGLEQQELMLLLEVRLI